MSANKDNLTLSLLQAALDSTADGILIVDLAGAIAGYNRRFVKLWNIPESILESRNDEEAINFAVDQVCEPQSFRVKVRDLYAHPEAKSFDILRLRDGRIIERYSRPQILEGLPVGRVWSFRDATRNYQIRDELQEQKYLLDFLLKMLPENIYFKNRDSRFLRVSDAMAGFFGLGDPSLAIGKTDFDFFSEEHAREAFACEQKIMQTGIGIYNIEEKETWPDGHTSWVSTSKVPLTDPSGEVTGTLGVSHNITPRKQAELALEKTNRAKDKFLSIIAHDLRNPLNSIMGFADLAIEEHNNTGSPELGRYISIIQSTAYQTYTLLEQLLQWARAHEGEITFNPGSFDLTDLIRQELEFQTEMANQKQIMLRSELLEPFPLVADLNMIRTIIRNLVNNALKFTGINGEILVKSSRNNSETIISVTDTGTGMPQSVCEVIFRLDSKYTTRGTQGEKGSGLGLILCLEFVNRHGGRIWVDSVVGKGTTFSFTIPD